MKTLQTYIKERKVRDHDFADGYLIIQQRKMKNWILRKRILHYH